MTAIVRERLPSLAVDLEALLGPGLGAIATRWPAAVIDAAFAAHVADCLARQRDPADAAAKLHADDLFLAWWAAGGSPPGVAAFEAEFGDEIERLAARFRDLSGDDARQQLRIRLLVGEDAKLREYTGVGPLLAWLRVVGVRYFIDLQRAARTRQNLGILDRGELDEIEVLGLPVKELPDSALGTELRSALNEAFAGAVGTLPARQRAFLRHAYVDRLTLDQIADTYRIHRATVARGLAAARAHVIEQTRAAISARLGIAPSSLASALGTLERQLDLSLSRILKPE